MTLLKDDETWVETPDDLKGFIKNDIDHIIGHYDETQRLSVYMTEEFEDPEVKAKVTVS